MKAVSNDFTRAIWEFLGWEAFGVEDRVEIKQVTQDSREVKRGSAFFAYDGLNFKGKDFIWDAFDKHATAVFVDREYKEEILNDARYNKNLPIFFTPDFLRAAGRTIAFFFGEPTRYMACIGVTGTNGKTTVAHSLYQALNHLKKPSMYIGTLGMEVTRHKTQTGMTTPDTVSLQAMLHQGQKQKALYSCIETSSHGLAQGRRIGEARSHARARLLARDAAVAIHYPVLVHAEQAHDEARRAEAALAAVALHHGLLRGVQRAVGGGDVFDRPHGHAVHRMGQADAAVDGLVLDLAIAFFAP